MRPSDAFGVIVRVLGLGAILWALMYLQSILIVVLFPDAAHRRPARPLSGGGNILGTGGICVAAESWPSGASCLP